MRGLGELNDLYEEIIIDHYRNPRNNEELENPDAEIEADNPFCGDEVKIQLKFQDGRVDEIGVTGRGCAISQSSASLLSESAEGRTQGGTFTRNRSRPAHDEGREPDRRGTRRTGGHRGPSRRTKIPGADQVRPVVVGRASRCFGVLQAADFGGRLNGGLAFRGCFANAPSRG